MEFEENMEQVLGHHGRWSGGCISTSVEMSAVLACLVDQTSE